MDGSSRSMPQPRQSILDGCVTVHEGLGLYEERMHSHELARKHGAY